MLFADGCALYTTTKTGNQQQVNSDIRIVENWFLEKKITINKDKTSELIDHRARFSCSSQSYIVVCLEI